jgi:hypothetical protein
MGKDRCTCGVLAQDPLFNDIRHENRRIQQQQRLLLDDSETDIVGLVVQLLTQSSAIRKACARVVWLHCRDGGGATRLLLSPLAALACLGSPLPQFCIRPYQYSSSNFTENVQTDQVVPSGAS